MLTNKLRWMKLSAAGAVGGMLLANGCGVTNLLSSINPCGTILNCDPDTFSYLTSGYEGPGVDTSVDIFCVFPPYCDDQPIVPAGS